MCIYSFFEQLDATLKRCCNPNVDSSDGFKSAQNLKMAFQFQTNH